MAKAAAKAKSRRAMKREVTDKTAQTFTEAGFSVEQKGVTTIYYRRISKDVVEASRALTQGRSMACPSKRKG